ncbi:hypothetical protein CKAH01_03628 [Colletotrichum kahawae]|uniref:Uncharacterized protein n=1 Tax=Colletotrichum kahawae TaxID=34407 RepID=A0AAD9YT58_COLKA|nr:hypothetical protein CKAH01_03628 [Colletotrichum kahawae]
MIPTIRPESASTQTINQPSLQLSSILPRRQKVALHPDTLPKQRPARHDNRERNPVTPSGLLQTGSSALICTSPSSCIPLQLDSSSRQVHDTLEATLSSALSLPSQVNQGSQLASNLAALLACSLLLSPSIRTADTQQETGVHRTAPHRTTSPQFQVPRRASRCAAVPNIGRPATGTPQGLISSILLQLERRESDRSLARSALLSSLPVSPRPSQDKAHSHFHQRPCQRQRQSFSHSSLVSDPLWSGLSRAVAAADTTPPHLSLLPPRFRSGRTQLTSSHHHHLCAVQTIPYNTQRTFVVVAVVSVFSSRLVFPTDDPTSPR